MGHDTTASYMSRLAHLLATFTTCPASHCAQFNSLPSPGLPPRNDDCVCRSTNAGRSIDAIYTMLDNVLAEKRVVQVMRVGGGLVRSR